VTETARYPQLICYFRIVDGKLEERWMRPTEMGERKNEGWIRMGIQPHREEIGRYAPGSRRVERTLPPGDRD